MVYANFDAMRRAARRMPPTKQHRPAVWECMLGTVYAANRERQVAYCDYDYKQAAAHVGDVEDVRVARSRQAVSVGEHEIREGQWVWWVRYAASQPQGGERGEDEQDAGQ